VAREAPLVSQYLEGISRGAVDKYRVLFRTYVRHRQGVYALYKNKKLYYVGLAGDLRWRLHQHLKDHHGQSWDRFSVYLTIGEKHLKELETLILHITGKPPGNKVKGKFRDSENLKRTLKRDIKAFQHMELLELMGQEVDEEFTKPRKRGGRRPTLAGHIKKAFRIRARYKGKLYKARVRRNGSVRYNGKTYNSPSAAGIAVTKRSIDGWYFWKYERAPGDWVKLNELRK
jgi:Restriction Enzyme Adenine Methylase Associated